MTYIHMAHFNFCTIPSYTKPSYIFPEINLIVNHSVFVDSDLDPCADEKKSNFLLLKYQMQRIVQPRQRY